MMGYVTCFVGYGVFTVLRWLMPSTKANVAIATAVGAWFGVVAASLLFVGYYAAGGTGDASIGTVAAAMVGVHSLVGIGEAVISGLTIASVLAVRPDLVYGARDLKPDLELRVPA
jgi:ABC-type Co2+ transport system permease subunit